MSINSTGSDIDEGGAITLTCVHDLIVGETFEWEKDEKVLKDKNESMLALEKVFSSDSGTYICKVYSPCGNYTSSPHSVNVKSK